MWDHRRRLAAELAGESEAMKSPAAKQLSPPASKPNRWNIYHVKGRSAALLRHVEAPDDQMRDREDQPGIAVIDVKLALNRPANGGRLAMAAFCNGV
jgi:hypothetical protein